jgi:hypothetical protein
MRGAALPLRRFSWEEIVVAGMGLLPIVPILLLPFIIIFFVVVFPLWGVALGVVGLSLLIIRAIDAIARASGVTAFTPAANAVGKAFRWVLTFGGLSERFSERRA